MSATELSCDDSEPPSSNLALFFNIDNDVEAVDIPSEEEFTAWALHAVKGIPEFDSSVMYEVSVSVVDEMQIQALNRDYRDKNKPTNVLSFPSNMPVIPATENTPTYRALGDIVLCHSVIATESMALQKKLVHHWAHMIVHSVLHLFDYTHEQTDAAVAMEELEVTLLAALSIPNPYQQSFQINE